MTRVLVTAVAAAVIVLLLLPSPSRGHIFSSKTCKTVPAIPDFDLGEFLGKWHVTHIYDSIFSCITVDYYAHFYGMEGIDDIGMNLYQYQSSPILKAINSHYHGLLSCDVIFDDSVESKMTLIDCPNKVAGNMSHVIVDTDYTSYALTYECQDIMFQYGSRFSANILSRKPEIDPDLVLQIRKTAAAKGIPGLHNLKYVDRRRCDDKDHSYYPPYDYNLDAMNETIWLEGDVIPVL